MGMPVLADEPLAGHTGLQVGGPADLFARPRTADEVSRALLAAGEEGIPVMVMGRGTNLLVGDGGIRGLVLLVGEGFEDDGVQVHGARCTVAAGVRLQSFLDRLGDVGLAGLEDLYGIPGSLGGALAMNAGAYGTEVWPRVDWVEAVLGSGELHRYLGGEIGYGYRRADLPPGAVVVRAEFVLDEGDPREIRRRNMERMADREAKHPLEWPNCGSVFKNFAWEPGMDLDYDKLESALGAGFSRRTLEAKGAAQLPAWRLVDACGLTGRQIGGAQISDKHSNFMVNLGGARAADFAALIELVEKTIEETFGFRLRTEVRRCGEFL
ncbi:MAG: UDP-N-acetylenolpyruvoylglucosamine reductase [Candidatus Coatesbacteria bacterium RBG_13_66_14]|uniref:UDP-N-acetylenolpyruvoylglucosamine reductase n=1 Tax=Candidatus Coatesbacteria bacterium RBG_13_66_14 TaxID=1817816 RepID=A0A1F5FJ16_9BACT|nr:MAG: UDP-N-acetylenolpyruvoylglucosamine reductase [Candidatus Coatesbacteria bacterium RBG_13_66_14]